MLRIVGGTCPPPANIQPANPVHGHILGQIHFLQPRADLPGACPGNNHRGHDWASRVLAVHPGSHEMGMGAVQRHGRPLRLDSRLDGPQVLPQLQLQTRGHYIPHRLCWRRQHGAPPPVPTRRTPSLAHALILTP